MTDRYGDGDVRFFDRFARLYDPLMPAAKVGMLHETFEEADRPVRRVLDLAGGTGRVADALRRANGRDAPKSGPVDETLVADISASMLSRARERGLETVRADAGTLPFEGGNSGADAAADIDAVVVVDAYHHLPDQSAALAEAARVVAPGGVVVVRDFDPTTLLGGLVETGESLFGMGSQFADADEVAAAMTRAGLRSRVLDRGWTYTVVGKRPREA